MDEGVVQFARDADEPDPEAAYDDVFAEQAPEVEAFRDQMRTDGGEAASAQSAAEETETMSLRRQSAR